ncbi:hypothetical protein GGX14DRAFT_696992 [Mycena pura]|uniref:DUF6534 domain-containing protein n=1 Tax=Mycena pura TaxID=153505 RepID=A0AAD6VQ17_9AGAR|nr:hypothetical protein GGX14DRAFT_696992 [Mycena pura]
MAGSGVELLFGPMLIGVLLSTAAYGVLAVQMFTYFRSYKKRDGAWIRYFMLYIFLAETANILLVIGIIYEPLIIRYGLSTSFSILCLHMTYHLGSPRALVISPLLLPADAISIVMVSTPIQLFTAWRISILTDSIVMSMIISVFSVASFGGGLLVTVFVSIRNEFQKFSSFEDVVILWLASSALCDVLIAAVLTYSLWTRKSGFSALDGQINRLIRLTVQTGVITAVAALADLIIFVLLPFIPDFPLSKLYSICLLSGMNARAREKAEDAEQRLPNALFTESWAKESGAIALRSTRGIARSDSMDTTSG